MAEEECAFESRDETWGTGEVFRYVENICIGGYISICYNRQEPQIFNSGGY